MKRWGGQEASHHCMGCRSPETGLRLIAHSDNARFHCSLLLLFFKLLFFIFFTQDVTYTSVPGFQRFQKERQAVETTNPAISMA